MRDESGEDGVVRASGVGEREVRGGGAEEVESGERAVRAGEGAEEAEEGRLESSDGGKDPA